MGGRGEDLSSLLSSLLSSVLRLGERSQGQELEPGAAVGGDGEDVGVVAVQVLVAGDDWEPVCRDEAGETPHQPGAASPHSLLSVGAEHGQVEGVNVGLQTGDNLLDGWRDSLLVLSGHQHRLYEVNIKEKLESKVLCQSVAGQPGVVSQDGGDRPSAGVGEECLRERGGVLAVEV